VKRALGPSFGRTFVAFRSRNYRLFWVGQLISKSGSWMQKVSQAWLVLQLTDSPLALGTVTALQSLPLLLLSLFGGVFADRVPKRRLLMVTQSIMALQAVILAALTASGEIQLWQVYLLATIFGLTNVFDNPARQAFLMELVGAEALPNAVALQSSLGNTTRIVGPAVAGTLIAWVGVAACFAINGLSYLAAIAALLAMRSTEFCDVPTPRRAPLVAQIREGLVYSFQTRDICLPVILLFALGCFGYNFNVVLPLLARYVLEIGPFGLGIMFASLGAGSVVTALVLASRREATERTMFIGAAIVVLTLFAVAYSPWLPLTAALLFLMGGAGTSFSSTANTRMQLTPPAELRGRVMSLFTLLWIGTTPVGSLTVGTLGEHVGVPPAIAASAGLSALGVVAALIYAHRQQTPFDAALAQTHRSTGPPEA
jgi:MFS family permease